MLPSSFLSLFSTGLGLLCFSSAANPPGFGVYAMGLMIPEHTHPKLAALMKSCWQQDPNLRPNFSEIIETFQQITNEIMRETLIYLTHLDHDDTEKQMLKKLSKQLNGEDWSWNNLNTLCWATRSIFGSMMEEQGQGMISFIHLAKSVRAAELSCYADVILDACHHNIVSDGELWH